MALWTFGARGETGACACGGMEREGGEQWEGAEKGVILTHYVRVSSFGIRTNNIN